MSKIWILFFTLFLPYLPNETFAQESVAATVSEPKPIAVSEVVSDKKIEQRLSEILTAVGTYEQVTVKVRSGVVILSGLVDQDRQIEWVQNLATRMNGVVAVQSQIAIRPSGFFDFTPAREELSNFNVTIMRHLPVILGAVIVLALSLLLFFLTSFGFRRAFAHKISSPLLLNATAKVVSIPIFLLGLYLALKISGLAGLAFTVLGGTGLLGLALGMAMKNSFDDYAASIFLSLKKPFRPSDWVKIADFEGIVQTVTSRSTLIIDFQGNHVLIPNSFVYKSVITNKTANPKMRGEFVVGIDYGDSIEAAQDEVLGLMAKSPFVLKDPEPWVLVDELAGSSVNLRVYFWLNVREISIFKVTSHLLLETKNLLLAKGFRFPDPQREVVFTNRLSYGPESVAPVRQETKQLSSKSPRLDEVRAEATELNRQARESNLPDQGENVI